MPTPLGLPIHPWGAHAHSPRASDATLQLLPRYGSPVSPQLGSVRLLQSIIIMIITIIMPNNPCNFAPCNDVFLASLGFPLVMLFVYAKIFYLQERDHKSVHLIFMLDKISSRQILWLFLSPSQRHAALLTPHIFFPAEALPNFLKLLLGERLFDSGHLSINKKCLFSQI